MRVTNKMLTHNFLSDMRTNLSKMKTLQEQSTSGKQVRKPSDDPSKVSRIMQINSDIVANKQYNSNIKDTINWLDSADTSLGQAGEVLKRVRELLVSTGNASYSISERKAVRDEINEKIEEFSQIVNTSFDGKYIFGGTRGLSKPMTVVKENGNSKLGYALRDGSELVDIQANASEYNMIGSKLKVEIAQSVYIEYNVTAQEITEFKNDKGEPLDVRKVFGDIVNHLGSDKEEDRNKLIMEDLQGISDIIDNVLKLRAGVGARQNRMDSAKERNTEENFNLIEILSEVEDVDITEKGIEVAAMQSVYVAALQASARIMQPTLLDYLR
ncbi:flagellar hook-associated protein 3 [Clostridium putrefaciens]|uniref:Flagellar hook-associated protein 3 n=1 Tax=Clostridium putrefaciens TaxID=99675 RepID=A0A381J914_9CLOT|nr:flagellar hook-associated protein FlgL [Clostridium putrefaciens]SUY47503.1 flagellar hook-associated protein 3 [Clostridium putrefaciens]